MEQLYSTGHAHASPRDLTDAGGIERLRAGIPPHGPRNKRFAFDHEHMPHIDSAKFSPFAEPAVDAPTRSNAAFDKHEHLPWTATTRGQKLCLRRLAALEMIYRLAPMLFTSGRLNLPEDRPDNEANLKMTDFHLLRNGGFFHAVSRYGDDVWITFTFLGLHVTERIVRRKQAHRFWGLDCYDAAEDRYYRTADRFFYESPQYPVEPSAQVILAGDAWTAELSRRVLVRTAPTLICTPDGRNTEPVAVRPSRDYISDPMQHATTSRTKAFHHWERQNRDLEAISGPIEFRLFMAIAEYPAMQSTGLREITGGSLRTVGRILDNFVKTGLAAIFDDRYFLAERGMKRAANLSRLRLDTISKRHAALLNVNFRHQERHHNDGVNRLVLKFASEGVKAFAGWRGEFNIPDITQIKPDLLVLVADGPFGTGPYCIEYERAAVHLNAAARKLGTYRKSAAVGQPVPVLVVCDTEYAAHNFIKTGRSLPVAATHLAAALTGPLTGDSTVWRQAGKPTDGGENWPDSSVRLHCRSSPKGTSDSF